MMRWFALVFLVAAQSAFAQMALKDSMDSASAWKAVASDGVSAKIIQQPGVTGQSVCLDYNFNGYSGYAVMQREMVTSHPEFFQYEFELRGDAPVNNLEFKLSDRSGDNVWWVSRKNQVIPKQWTHWTLKDRHFSFAWGPIKDQTLRETATFEMTVSAGRDGGHGVVCLDDLKFGPRVPPSKIAPRMVADSSQGSAALAVDGNVSSAWTAPTQSTLRVDLGEVREFSAIVLDWLPKQFASAYSVELSDDGQTYRPWIRVTDGDGGRDYLAVPESQARYVRLQVERGVTNDVALAELRVMPLGYAETPTVLLENVAKDQPRGNYPRGMRGEQPYWTLIGLDGGREHGLVSEDGALELHRSGPSIEPFVSFGPRIYRWSDVRVTQSLVDGYLPMPRVEWKAPEFDLAMTYFVRGKPGASQQVVRYVLTNKTKRAQEAKLHLALRPLQVNPPKQFLSTQGGFAPVSAVAVEQRGLRYNDDRVVQFSRNVSSHGVGDLQRGSAVESLLTSQPLKRTTLTSNDGTADAVATFNLRLAPGERREVVLISPLEGDGLGKQILNATAARVAQDEVANIWREKLDRTDFELPGKHRHIVDTMKTGLAHMLISRIGPRLQPGTRSYSRAWIRDGAMISEALLRMGREDVAKDFLAYYTPYQFESGKVPCCVDDRGSDPVPENDSHGELIFNIAEVYRYTHDKSLLEKYWPNVVGAMRYMEELRLSERTDANRATNAAFYGMMPASISHEGYSAKPMHSYWDNFWALRGYKDAVEIAQVLGKPELAQYTAARDQFTSDLYASITAAMKIHGINFIPGAAELGDFDATSTTIALSPGGEFGRLPQPALTNTFERYWTEFVQRRDGKRVWKDYTPYELRAVGAFTRMGWKERANEALDFFFKDQQPRGWNQWAEVVSVTPRVPFFVGDLPHAWVESDYVRSALDMFAYYREADSSLVLAAGAIDSWLDEKGMRVSGMRTPYGPLNYRYFRDGKNVKAIIEKVNLPNGGIVLTWPLASTPGPTKVNGRIRTWQNGELHIDSVPATVEVEMVTK